MAGVKFTGSLVLCAAKTGLMVVTKCLLALGVGQKVSADTKRPKLPSSTLRVGLDTRYCRLRCLEHAR